MSLSIYTRTETCQVTTCDVEKSTKASRRDLLEGAGTWTFKGCAMEVP